MGREIRRVPPNYKHPLSECKHWPVCEKSTSHYQPMFSTNFEKAANEWIDECISWTKGTHPDFEKYGKEYPYYWMWNGDPPDKKYYSDYKPEDAIWVCVYETVSEGTPVTPPFETKDELVNYLVANGDYWDQNRGHGGWDRKSAESFVDREWAPSMVVNSSKDGIKIMEPRNMDDTV